MQKINYICRNKNGVLVAFKHTPEKREDKWLCPKCNKQGVVINDSESYQIIKWSDELPAIYSDFEFKYVARNIDGTLRKFINYPEYIKGAWLDRTYFGRHGLTDVAFGIIVDEDDYLPDLTFITVDYITSLLNRI